MAINYYYSDEISFSSLKRDFQSYCWEFFRQDAISAISVAFLTLPQAMAYALLAGLPISCGLFAAIYSSIAAAVFGSSRHLVVGPSNAIAILVQAAISEIIYTYFRDLPAAEKSVMAVQLLTQLVFLTGILQLIAAGCKLGRLTQFVSYSVIIGYMAGTAIAVVINQLFTFLGIPRVSSVRSLYENGVYLLTHLNEIHIPTTILGITTLSLMIILKRLDRRIPVAVISLIYASVVVYLIDLSIFNFDYRLIEPYSEDHAVALIGDSGKITDMMPLFQMPFFNAGLMNELLPVAFALALLSIMETTSVAKSIAASSGQRLSINQEIFGIGIGNFLSSFISAMPVSGSPSRSSLNFFSGAQTRFATILNALIVAFFLYTFGSWVTRIPLAALAALLLVTAMNIVNIKHLLVCLKATSSDAFVLWITLLSCIFFSFDIAFYIGVFISIILYLKKAAIPQLVEYDVDESGELKNLDFQSSHVAREIRIIKVEGELFFGAADLFQKTLKAFAEDDISTKVIILQLKNARDIDATACLALLQLHDYLKSSNRFLIACGITQPIWDVLSDSGIIEKIGKENLLVFDERHPHHYLQKALQRARDLIQTKVNPVSPEFTSVKQYVELIIKS